MPSAGLDPKLLQRLENQHVFYLFISYLYPHFQMLRKHKSGSSCF